MDQRPRSIERGLATLRMVAFALAAGVAVLLVVAAAIAPVGEEALQERGRLFVGIAFLLAAGHVVAYFVIGRAMAAKTAGLPRGHAPEAAEAWFPVYQAKTIIGCALAEGAALLAITFYILTGAHALVVIPVLSIVAIALQFPSREAFEAFAASSGRP